MKFQLYQIIYFTIFNYDYIYIFNIGTIDTESFADLTILAVGDSFQLSPVGGRPVSVDYKNTSQNLNS